MGKRPTIHLLSAADRFNYGDLLFSLILTKELDAAGNYNILNYATTDSDLTNLGAIKTSKYTSLYGVTPGNNWLLIAGGEVMGANWSRLMSFIYKPFFWIYEKAEIFNQLNALEKATKYYLGVNSNLAFVPNEEIIKNNFNIIYNSVGGIFFEKNNYKNDLKNLENNIKYFSTRDAISHESISRTGIKDVKLTPDSAILMSKHYPREKLLQMTSSAISNIPENYITLQLGYKKSIGNFDEIAQQMEMLSNELELPIILCPIGNCPGHDDSLALEIIAQKVKNAILIKPKNLWDIMHVISNSKIFVGTSLHGVITAMSYSIPYLGINKEIHKLDAYLKTWGIQEFNTCIDFIQIAEQGIKVATANSIKLEESRVTQITLAHESIRNIAKTINQFS